MYEEVILMNDYIHVLCYSTPMYFKQYQGYCTWDWDKSASQDFSQWKADSDQDTLFFNMEKQTPSHVRTRFF